MQHLLSKLALTVTIPLAFLVLSAAPAQAHSNWTVGTGFSIGGFDFGIYYQPGQYRDFYFRVKRPLAYSGYQCSDRCYVNQEHTYHYASCPVVRHHFSRYRFNPLRHLEALFSSSYRSYRGHDHDDYRDHHRSDRHDRSRYDDRYDRHDRYNRHDRDHRYNHSSRHRVDRNRNRNQHRGHHYNR